MKKVYKIVLAVSDLKDRFFVVAESFERAVELANKNRSYLGWEIEAITELGTLREETE